MTEKAFRPDTLWGSAQAENHNLAGQQIEVLNSKSPNNIQAPRLVSYVVDGQLNVIHVQFSPKSKWGDLS